MELENLSIPATNRFASLYLEQKQPVKDFFHYDIRDSSVFKRRAQDLRERTFNREKLANCIEQYMRKFPSASAVEHSIKKLRNHDSVVVIGGQQAGLLTGPLYTIHKIISIIKLAKEQEKLLNQPVVPVFWIAGEDHDYLEVNHVYVERERQLKKMSYVEGPIQKKMVADITLESENVKKWIHQIFEHLGETTYTKDILKQLDCIVDNSNNMVECFAFIINELFKEYGLLLIDSANSLLRQLETSHFKTIIEHYDTITKAVLAQQELIQKDHFPKAIDISEEALNLFYYDGKERILLEYDRERNGFLGKNTDLYFTKEQLLEICDTMPELLSNNVVTRPLMQEWLFPTLAFIGGPGEIAYWGELKRVFEAFKFHMPPMIPRLNITLLERSIQRDIETLQLSVEEVLKQGTANEKEEYWNTIKEGEYDDIINEMRIYLEEQYKKLSAQTDDGIHPLIEKNLAFHTEQFNFLQRKIYEQIERRHDVVLEKYARIERSLRPNNIPQERVWNVFYFINKYGPDFIPSLMSLTYSFDGTHKLIRI
ncbi:bacillithiol biosynthesis cysteine-adding enzyme BshC [Heyndrickxia ginsengihumi]|uniref:bacillithiol biosynthesis cysteine-adding enzyme BshC n=1 Tax=Heyndrickxia ginsengihumi TaxID=363870 RepID=UPI003D1DDB75